MANMKRFGYLDNGIFPGTVLFSCGNSYAEIIEEIRKSKEKYWEKGISTEESFIDNGCSKALHRTIIKGDRKINLYYIILNGWYKTDYDYVVLAHECLHITQFFLSQVLERDREIEAEAYYHSHIMQQCLDLIRQE